MKRYCKIAAIFLMAIFSVLMMIFLWTLYKPFHLNFAETTLESYLSNDNFQIDIEGAKLVSGGNVRLLGLELDKINVTDLDTKKSYEVKNITLDVSGRSLLYGEFALNQIIIDQLDIAAIDVYGNKAPESSSENSSGNSGDNASFDQTYAQIDDFLSLSILKPLRNIIIKESNLILALSADDDVKLITHELRFVRRGQKRFLEIKAEFIGKVISAPNIHFALAYNPKNKAITADIYDIATTHGQLTGTAALNHQGAFKFNLAPKKIYDGVIYTTPTNLSAIYGHGHWDDMAQNIIINALEFDFTDKLKVMATAKMNYGRNANYAFNADIHALTLPNLLKLWPKAAAPAARSWVNDNMLQADFNHAEFKIAGKFGAQPKLIYLNAPVEKAEFSFLKPMQPAEDAQGSLNIDNKKFLSKLTKGRIGKIDVTNAIFEIPDIFSQKPHGQVKVDMQGKVKEILSLIDQEPLKLMQKGGFEYQRSKGNFIGQLSMDIPLLKNTLLKDIKIETNVTVKNGSLRVGAKKLPLEGINGKLLITANKAQGAGTVALFGTRHKFNWKENFNLASKVTTDIKLKTLTNIDELQYFTEKLLDSSLIIADYAQGEVFLDTHLQLRRGRITRLDINANAEQIHIGTPQDVWKIPQGSAKTLKVSGYQKKNDDFFISKISLVHPDLTFSVADMLITKGVIAKFSLRALDFKNVLMGLSGAYNFTDQQHIFQGQAVHFSLPEYLIAASETAPEDILHPYLNWNIKLDAQDVFLTEYKNVKNAHIHATRNLKNERIINAVATSPELEKVTIDIEKTALQARKIQVKTQNAGSLLSQSKFFDRFEGGTLDLVVNTNPSGAAGIFHIQNGQILEAPWIADLLSVASLSGILDRLNDRGLAVDNIKVEFAKQGDILTLKEGLLHGSAIGLSFQGDYQMADDILDIYGTVVPFYGLNSLVSEIPIIGQITSSREGEGIFGMTYKMQGPSEGFEISVNPLSILSPGILRRIFE